MMFEQADELRDAAVEKYFELEVPRLLAEILVVLIEIRDGLEAARE